MATIRELFHGLGNKHNVITVGCGATKEVIEECLEEKSLSEETKKRLDEAVKNLEIIVNDALEADKITTEVHDRIYKIIDPDTGKPKELKDA